MKEKKPETFVKIESNDKYESMFCKFSENSIYTLIVWGELVTENEEKGLLQKDVISDNRVVNDAKLLAGNLKQLVKGSRKLLSEISETGHWGVP